LFNVFRIYTHLYEYVLNLFKNIHTAGLPHTAAPLDSRTLPRALPDSRTLLHTLPYCWTQPCALPHTMPHTAWIWMPHTAHRILHTAHSRTPQLKWIKIYFMWMYMHLHDEFTWIYVNSYESKQLYFNVYELTWILTWFCLVLFQII